MTIIIMGIGYNLDTTKHTKRRITILDLTTQSKNEFNEMKIKQQSKIGLHFRSY